MADQKKVDIYLEIKRETDKAFLVTDGESSQWLPKSQIKITRQGDPGETVLFTIPEWLAIERGFV
ncbi:MAG: hypothetical protein HN597_14960 [Desulfobacula sp.]|jgi:hypothetical protein|uniref:Uncharacterized protein n=1 Tax=uncultured marine virus TaxID=186617 RepID=A0A0F7L4V8_9VIRU|nr:hypothetical protein ORF063 [uncultured marine virus]MBT7630983.1 hypothetical protein [Desulfobacula sp.]